MFPAAGAESEGAAGAFDPAARFATTTVELDYLDGIDRLDNPEPLRVRISAAGVQVEEILPGSRKSLIPADALIAAEVTDATVVIEKEKKPTRWGWLWLGSRSRSADESDREVRHDYILTIRYHAGGEVRTAVFHREDSQGKTYIANVAKTLNALITSRRKDS